MTCRDYVQGKCLAVLTQNNQTPYRSQQSLVDVQWGEALHKNGLLNTGLRSELPVRWSGDEQYETAGNTTITFSFIGKTSILGYGDDVNEIIKPTHDFSQKQKNDIRKIFDNLESYVNIKFDDSIQLLNDCSLPENVLIKFWCDCSLVRRLFPSEIW